MGSASVGKVSFVVIMTVYFAGVDRLLKQSVYVAAYPLHEGPYTSPNSILTEGALNDRHVCITGSSMYNVHDMSCFCFQVLVI